MKAKDTFTKRVYTLLGEANTLEALQIAHEQLCDNLDALCNKMTESRLFTNKEVDEVRVYCNAILCTEYGYRHQEVRDQLREVFDVTF